MFHTVLRFNLLHIAYRTTSKKYSYNLKHILPYKNKYLVKTDASFCSLFLHCTPKKVLHCIGNKNVQLEAGVVWC